MWLPAGHSLLDSPLTQMGQELQLWEPWKTLNVRIGKTSCEYVVLFSYLLIISGVCDRSNGQCACFSGMGSSGGSNTYGQRNDCGYVIPR